MLFRSNANPGDEITVTVTMGPVEKVGTLQMVMDIPAGLSYVAGSGRLLTTKEAIGYDALDWTEVSKMINGYASAGNYASTSDTVLGSYKVTVDDDASGNYTIGLTNLEFGDCATWEAITDEFYVTPATVTVGGSQEETEIGRAHV